MDEAYVGGRRTGFAWRADNSKTTVLGMKERDGFLRTEVIERADTKTLREAFKRNIDPYTVVSTDEYRAYNLLEREGYIHGAVQHNIKEYAKTDENGYRHHTNGVENFWKLFKSSVRSTHIQISKHKAQAYLNEFTFRQNHREMQNAMFDVLIAAV
jgi:transposase-like protein